jgi:hypothetical protein
VSTGFVYPQDAKDPRFRELFDYWRSKAPAADKLPGRQHIDPLEIPHLLPGIALFDVVPAGGRYRFRFRLMGTTFVDAIGADHTGRFVDEVVLHIVKYESLHEALVGMIRTRQPHYWETPATMSQRKYMALQRLALPLARDGETVDMIIGYYIPVVRPRPVA